MSVTPNWVGVFASTAFLEDQTPTSTEKCQELAEKAKERGEKSRRSEAKGDEMRNGKDHGWSNSNEARDARGKSLSSLKIVPTS